MTSNTFFKEFRMKKSSVIVAALAIVLCSAMTAFAQPNQQTNTSQVNWQEELKNTQEENRALKNILAAIQSIDTARQNELIQFIITDRSVRSRVISALRKSGKEISPSSNADLTATQKPGSRDALKNGNYNDEVQLLRIVIDNVGIYGAPTIKKILGENLYNKINDRYDYEYTMVSTPTPQQKIQYAQITASLFSGDIIFKSGFGVGYVEGNDYIGYPFWLPGNVAVQGIIHQEMTDVRLGLNFQLGEGGITPFGVSGGSFRIKERKLEGTQGFDAMINQALNVLPDKNAGRLTVGGAYYQAFTPNITNFSLRANDKQYRSDAAPFTNGVKRDSLYYIDLSAHGWVGYAFTSGSLRGLYGQVGAGTHRVYAMTVGQKGTSFGQPGYSDLIRGHTYEQFDPMLKIGYMHGGNDGNDWGISLQYSNMLLADGFIQIFNWLDIEAKYAANIGNNTKTWEWSDYIMISPVLRLNF